MRDVNAVIRILGAPATGKTTVRIALAAALGLAHSSIDAERLRIMSPGDVWPEDDTPAWRSLRRLVLAGPCIVETSGRSPLDSWLFADVETFIVLCVAERDVRFARLIERVRTGYPLARIRNYVERLIDVPVPVIRADVVWHGGAQAPIAPLADRIALWLADMARIA